MKNDVKVGQTVYLKPEGNRMRGSGGAEVVEGEVKTVGRKYYTVTVGYREYVFDKSTLREKSDYTPEFTLYFDRQTLIKEQERSVLSSKLLSMFSWHNSPLNKLTLEQLKRIEAIIQESSDNVSLLE